MAAASYALVSARYGRHKPPSNLLLVVILITLLILLFASLGFSNQTQPDAKRIREIQAALIAHGYEPGRSWAQTQEQLKLIARAHHWQSKHAPDARVLILLGLGNKYSNPEVLDEPTSHLEGVGK
jgi:hypothetical protein